MKLLLDQGLPRSAVRLLSELGVDAIHTGECGLATAKDSVVLQFAHDQGRTVVTLDSDFHALIAAASTTAPSVIRVRIEGLGAKAMADLLKAVLGCCGDDLARGALVSVTEDQIRVHSLPLRA